MALSILPTVSELANLTTIEEVRTWAGCDQATWKAASDHLGSIPSLRYLALVPSDVLKSMLERVRIPANRPAGVTVDPPPCNATAVEVIQLAVMWRVARLAYQLPDIDILAPAPVIPAPNPTGPVPKTATKKVKLSVHLDQMDENEVELISRTDLDACYRTYRDVTGSDPQPDCDPTMEQVTAMRVKLLERDEPPYADFSVLVPHGRELQKSMKTRSWLLQSDGSWKGVDIPGPPNYPQWLKCWRVYRTVLLMLSHAPNSAGDVKPVITIAALEEYADKIYELCTEFPECYHLIWQAEDKCRRDEFGRIRRMLTRGRLEGSLPMTIRFDPQQPWVGVMTYAARDGEYWAKHVVRPAQTFLARGGAGRKMTQEAAESVLVDGEVLKNAKGEPSPPGQGASRNARKSRVERLKRDEPGKRAWGSSTSAAAADTGWGSSH